MSTKAKIGKDWIKCQITLPETGETLHLTFAPGQLRKKIVVNVDGRIDTGTIALETVKGATPPHDAALVWEFKGEGIHTAKASVAAPKPVVPPAPPTPVAAPEQLPPPPEEITVTEVQEPAADVVSVSGGKRATKRTASGQA